MLSCFHCLAQFIQKSVSYTGMFGGFAPCLSDRFSLKLFIGSICNEIDYNYVGENKDTRLETHLKSPLSSVKRRR